MTSGGNSHPPTQEKAVPRGNLPKVTRLGIKRQLFQLPPQWVSTVLGVNAFTNPLGCT